ncbi:hypothetical protein [Litchfieldella xinjiangensis]|uniref:hypothetical protein n=1 Tax=Litchfieldella xinjiangensis TaxID=1166948 RepID=UPI0006946A13|nr:hypothetical protein [Halomonas xinjiangensis]
MLNRSRELSCPQCDAINAWTGEPAPDDALHCTACSAYITSYDDYIREAVRREVKRLMDSYRRPSPARELAILKRVLARPTQPYLPHVLSRPGQETQADA